MKFNSYFWLIPFISFVFGYYLVSLVYQSPVSKTPSLVGTSLQDAVLQTSELNLNIRIVGHKQETDLPEATIMSQMPQAGTAIKANQALYCVISEKPAIPHVPHLLKKNKEAVIAELNKRGLRFKIFYTESILPLDTCVAQWPNSGTQGDVTKSVIMYLSAGSNKPIIWPDFKGMPLPDVLEFLAIQGISPIVNHTTLLEPGHVCGYDCLVVDQRPVAGSILALNSNKNLQVQLQVCSPNSSTAPSMNRKKSRYQT